MGRLWAEGIGAEQETNVSWSLVGKAMMGQETTSLTGDSVFGIGKLGNWSQSSADIVECVTDAIAEASLTVVASEEMVSIRIQW